MSLYHEAAEALSTASGPGSFKSRIFGNRQLRSSPAQVYALAIETCKWSTVLSEIIDAAGLLQAEKKVS